MVTLIFQNMQHANHIQGNDSFSLNIIISGFSLKDNITQTLITDVLATSMYWASFYPKNLEKHDIGFAQT